MKKAIKEAIKDIRECSIESLREDGILGFAVRTLFFLVMFLAALPFMLVICPVQAFNDWSKTWFVDKANTV